MENYVLEGDKPLGKGSFGQVFKARERGTGRIVALKRMKFNLMENGLPAHAMREISNLKELKHKNIVRILNVLCEDTGTLYLVMEHLDMDLHRYMDVVRRNNDSGRLPVPLIQKFTRQLMKGLAYCHSHRIVHRDLKPGNILMDVAQQRLKIADFGSSRAYSFPLVSSPDEVTTLQYRAPEVLLGERNYTSAIDIWSVGCIIAEMARAGMLIFRGNTVDDHIKDIFRVLGTPDETIWPGVSALP
ncbi:Cyclin-dependent kinase catalytic subunit, partial [Ceratobasidium sp. 394]